MALHLARCRDQRDRQGLRALSARRRVRLAAVVLVLLGGLTAAWVGLRLSQARTHLDAARTQLLRVRVALEGDGADAVVDRALGRAAAQTRQARRELDDPLVRLVGALPLTGRTVSVARAVGSVTDDLVRDVLPAAASTARTLRSGALRRPDGSVDLALVERAGTQVAAAATRAGALDARLRALPRSGVLGPVSRARTALTAQADALVRALDGARTATVVAPRFLGAAGPRTWFVLVQQTSESRGTGGLPGGFAVLRAVDGRLSVLAQGSDADLRQGDVEPVGLANDVTTQYGELGAFELWNNINLSPDLPVVARYLEQRWKAQTGQAVDGVLTVDALALSDLLQGSGPIRLPSGTSLQPAQLPQYLALGQYVGVTDPTARKQGLVEVADQVLRRLVHGGGDTAGLLRGLRAGLASGHARLATDDPVMAPLLHAQHVDGSLPDTGTPFAYPVVFNASGDKLDYYLDRTVRYTRLGCSGGRRQTRVAVTLRTDPPALAALPPYVTVSERDRVVNTLTDRFGLSVYATAGSRLVRATLDGRPLGSGALQVPHLEAWTEAGLPLWRTFVDLPPHRDLVLVLDLDEPGLRAAGRLLQPQPLAREQRSEADVPACRP